MINLFRQHQIFDNLVANQLCDELATAVAPTENYPQNFILSGAAAYALQQEYTQPLQNIIFRAITEETYFRILNYLDRISTKEMVKYANRVSFKFPAGAIEICFMIMYDAGFETSSLEYQGIIIENHNFINPELYA